MLDIYISTLNRELKLKRCVESIIYSTYKDWRLVVRYNLGGNNLIKNANRELREMHGDVFMGVSDDLEFLPASLEHLVRFIEKVAPDFDCVIGLNQINIPDAPDSALCAVGRKFAERFPNMQAQCPEYFYFGADREMDAYAKEVGKFFYCHDAQVIHHHPSIEPIEMDATHRQLRDAIYQKDLRTLNARMKAGLLWGRSFECLS